MIKNFKFNKLLWLTTAVFSFFVSMISIFNQEIYQKVVSKEILPGVISQDLITALISIVLIYLVLKIKKKDIKNQIIIFSFLAYIFYAYGIYVIEQLYNSFYIFYLLIVSLSFWSLIFSLLNYDNNLLKKVELNKNIHYPTIFFLIFIPLLFYFLWISQLLPLMRTGAKQEFTFSIYILDIVFILPAFIITAFLAIKEKISGYLLAPLLFFKAFSLLFSVALGGFIRPFYNLSFNFEETFFYLILSLVFLALAVFNFLKLKITFNN